VRRLYVSKAHVVEGCALLDVNERSI